MSGSWRRLHLPKSAGLPPLLYKYVSTPTSYEICMTDLTNIWSERMTRQAILKRADEIDATIDPSEDPEQFEMLLQKINDALQNRPGSSITLQHISTSASSLELLTTIKLPAPLKPLKWVLKLSKEPPSATTKQLLLPLIEAEVSRTLRQQTLIDQLNKKDWVLGKLFDKIEAVGIDLSTIFPGMSGLRSGRKGTTLAQAVKYIKGVAPFDEQAWLDEVRQSSSDADLASNIFAEVTGSGSGRGDDTKLRPPPEAWWEDLSTVEQDRPPSPVQENSPEPELKPSKEDVEMDTDPGAETEDDEFERQETPPGLKRPQSPKPTEKEDEKGQETETDDESPPGSPLPTRQKQPSKPTKGLGVIGGSKRNAPKQPSPQPSPTPEPITKQSPSRSKRHIPTDDNDNDKTDSGSGSESDDLEDHTPPPPKESPKPKPAAKPRGLGVIGGKKKETTPVPPPATSPSPHPQSPTSKAPKDQGLETSSEPAPAPKPKRLGKLGVIGGKASKPRAETHPPREVPSGSSQIQSQEKDVDMEATRRTKLEATKSPSPVKGTPTTQPEEPKKEETEQERADRKREELKRQLEAKAKAPVKKKRRF